MIIDGHNHVWDNSPKWPDLLVRECDTLLIDKVVLTGLPKVFGFSSNDLVLAAVQQHPDRLIGFAFIDLGKDTFEDVDRYKEQGFRGLKFHIPRIAYGDERAFPIYERAQEFGMPCLYHTGIVMRLKASPEDYFIDTDKMRPIHLDTISRAFPKLSLIGAHFGNPWADEASMVCRINPNVYFDLSGSTLKWRSHQQVAELLWWRSDYWGGNKNLGAWQKIIFGSDYGLGIKRALDDYQAVLDYCGVSPEEQALVYGETIARILNHEKE